MYSLRRRLLISAALLLLLFLGIMAVGLNNAFKKSVLSNAEDALRNQILLLISSIDVIDGKVFVPSTLPEPRLAQMDADLFAQIHSEQSGVVWRSPSLLDNELPLLNNSLGEFAFIEQPQWAKQPSIYAMTLGVEWETDNGDLPFTIQIAEHSKAYQQRLARYQRTVGLWLAVLGGLLLLLLLLLLGWTLKPLDKVTKQVGEIEEGKRQRFDEDYPMEVSRLTQNLNQLLNFDEQRINRQKEVLGNLAHSLKTPIAVLSGLNYSNETQAEAHQQLSVMQNIIDYQLQSASAVGRQRFAKPIDVRAATEQIVNSLNKLHQHKNLQAHIEFDSAVKFYGDQGDWMELAGNLLDNAFKWAKGNVLIRVMNTSPANQSSHRLATKVMVEDDGAGIDDELKATILQRGVRLDSQTPGHGLGLHIVKGIVEAYDGDIAIADNTPQGTRFTVVLN